MSEETRISVVEAKSEFVRSTLIASIGWILILTALMGTKFFAVNSRFDTLDAKFESKLEVLDAKLERRFDTLQELILERLPLPTTAMSADSESAAELLAASDKTENSVMTLQ